MAIIAGITAGDMVGRFAQGRDAVVATAAVAQYGGVVNPGDTGEITSVMAILASIQSPHMVRGFTRCRGAVVATGTAGRDTGMVKYRPGK